MEASSDTKHACSGTLDTAMKNGASFRFQTAYYKQNQEGGGSDIGTSDRRRTESWGNQRRELCRVITSNASGCKYLLIATQHIRAYCCQVQLREVSFVCYPCFIHVPFVALTSCLTVDGIIYLQERSTDQQSTTTFISVYCLQHVSAFATVLNQAIKKYIR